MPLRSLSLAIGFLLIVATTGAQPAGPAPEARIAAVNRLIGEGKQAEATMLVAILLELHPEDKRVIALHQKLGGQIPAVAPAPAVARPAAKASSIASPADSGAFTVLERVQLNAIETLARESQAKGVRPERLRSIAET